MAAITTERLRELMSSWTDTHGTFMDAVMEECERVERGEQ